MQDDIPVTLITDSMAGHFLSRQKIDCVIVGADRIAANGDTANKIGTYTLAVLANENSIPFWLHLVYHRPSCPPATAPIESGSEVTRSGHPGQPSPVANPA
jgi:hypothetical protein